MVDQEQIEHKRWLSYEEQLQLLRQRGMIIEDETKALNYLQRLGYYRFCLMQQLVSVICPNSSWGQRFKDHLEQKFPPIPESSASLYDFGIIDGWREWELWREK